MTSRPTWPLDPWDQAWMISSRLKREKVPFLEKVSQRARARPALSTLMKFPEGLSLVALLTDTDSGRPKLPRLPVTLGS